MKHKYWYVEYVTKLRYLKKKELTVKQQKKVYDALYYLADLMLKKHRPCQIEQVENVSPTPYNIVSCLQRRELNLGEGTCCSCNYLGMKGCTVKALGCKLFLCDYILGIEAYNIVSYGLGALTAYAWALNEKFVAYYVSKADVFNKNKKIYVNGEEVVAKHG
jgi:hypothetical protein